MNYFNEESTPKNYSPRILKRRKKDVSEAKIIQMSVEQLEDLNRLISLYSRSWPSKFRNTAESFIDASTGILENTLWSENENTD